MQDCIRCKYKALKAVVLTAAKFYGHSMATGRYVWAARPYITLEKKLNSIYGPQGIYEHRIQLHRERF